MPGAELAGCSPDELANLLLPYTEPEATEPQSWAQCTPDELADALVAYTLPDTHDLSTPNKPDAARPRSSEVHTPQDVADSVVLATGRPRTSVATRRVRANARYARQKLQRLAKEPGPDQDRLLAAAVRLPGAEHNFTEMAAVVGSSDSHVRVVENCRKLIGMVGKRHKRACLQLLAQGVPTAFVKRVLGVCDSAIKEARRSDVLDDATIGTDNYKNGTERDKVDPLAVSLMMRFFVETTHVLSGAVRETRNLEMRLHEWEAELSTFR